ncbi:MAG: hypothetical protein U0791_10145 [Gemmataceae bacterium]
MSKPVECERRTPVTVLHLAGDAIRGEIVLPISAAETGADEANPAHIVRSTIEACSRLPEFVKFRQAAGKGKAIGDRLRECRNTLAELVSKQAEVSTEQSVDDLLATGEAIRTRQAEVEVLQSTADQIAPIVRSLAANARSAVINASHDELTRHRLKLVEATNAARARAAALLPPVAAQVDAIATSSKAVAAVTAHAEALRLAAASKQLNGATSEILTAVVAGLDLATCQP